MKERIIAVDFDGTLCKHNFPNIGEIQPKNQRIIDYIRYRKKQGCIIILWTCRCDTETNKYLTEAVNWCKEQNIPIDYVNENVPKIIQNFGWDTRKVIADEYIDDKAVELFRFDDPASIPVSIDKTIPRKGYE